jgi:general nucleoside transport system permease protein
VKTFQTGTVARRFMTRTFASLLPVVLAVAVVVGLLLIVGAPPLQALHLIWNGSVGTSDKIGDTLMAWVPLTLAGAGLVVTFTAGLWNIGIEGQIVMGAIAATWAGRTVPGGAAVLITAMMMAGVVGGALWALLAGVLKTRGRVNEIFGGLGLDFVASGLAVYLIIGPWKRRGIASTSGTSLLRPEATLPVAGQTRMSLVAVVIAVAALVMVFLLIRGTRFGLRLRAVGRNPRSAFLLGIPTDRYLLGAFAVCGSLAGVAGAIQVAGVWHKLVPSISGGYGFLAILVALLAGFRALRIAPIAFFFAIVAVGSSQLTLFLGLNSAVGGVLQAVIVLFVILGGGWQLRRAGRRLRGAPAGLEPAAELTETATAQVAPVEQPVSAEP